MIARSSRVSARHAAIARALASIARAYSRTSFVAPVEPEVDSSSARSECVAGASPGSRSRSTPRALDQRAAGRDPSDVLVHAFQALLDETESAEAAATAPVSPGGAPAAPAS